MKKNLVLFDFDGTITTTDTFLEFIKFYCGTLKFYFGFLILSPIMILMVLKIIPNWRGKEVVLTWFFKGEDVSFFTCQGERFCLEIVPKLIRPEAIASIKNHQLESSEVTVVSASAENWVAPWCKLMNMNCIATKLEIIDNKLTGKILGKNCYGEEKVVQIKLQYNLNAFEKITAFGDSSGDKQMLAIAHEKFYKPFRTNDII